MPNQLIQDPNKLPSENNEVSIKDIVKPISYFLAGSLIIWTTLSPKLTNAVVLEPMEWFTAILGALLVVAGFISLTIIPFGKRAVKVRKFFKSRVKNYLDAVVFAVVLSTLLASVLSFRDYTPLYIAGIVFLCIVMLMIIILSWSKVIKNLVSLMTVLVSLNVLTIIILFAGANDTELATVLGLSLIFLFLALNGIAKRTTSS